VRSAADPEPAFKGYAMRVLEARKSKMSAGSASVAP
jgi:hypothetical protein